MSYMRAALRLASVLDKHKTNNILTWFNTEPRISPSRALFPYPTLQNIIKPPQQKKSFETSQILMN